ncbi:hypothetical protein J1N35_012541 [Gossypium stocksii]|uniref:RNase H type-1 domain-containing protein n=1 Tax=Gossypium stocksii TaxID=47602 RepID=A0A9D3W5C4_9ROSI|nr:hypothetical protein J1N35_012541 [Gossypium stocksii]
MRALLWVRSNNKDFMLQEKFWWIALQRCHETTPCGWLKFNVCGIAKENKAGCRGILRDLEEVARGVFYGDAGSNNAEVAEIGAVKIALEMNGNDMAFSLALAGVNRPQVFKAWW